MRLPVVAGWKKAEDAGNQRMPESRLEDRLAVDSAAVAAEHLRRKKSFSE